MTILRFVLGDQLTRSLSALADLDPERDVVLITVSPEWSPIRAATPIRITSSGSW